MYCKSLVTFAEVYESSDYKSASPGVSVSIVTCRLAASSPLASGFGEARQTGDLWTIKCQYKQVVYLKLTLYLETLLHYNPSPKYLFAYYFYQVIPGC
jgi:hypothetical protein